MDLAGGMLRKPNGARNVPNGITRDSFHRVANCVRGIIRIGLLREEHSSMALITKEMVAKAMAQGLICGLVECPECHDTMEPDAERCPKCGQLNPCEMYESFAGENIC
jgi:hypothetical protein